MAAKRWHRVWIPVSDDLTPSQRETFAAEIVEFIRQRTENEGLGLPFGKYGVVKNYQPFPSYSKSYVNSPEFKAAGKSSGDIDLTLTGEMLAALDVLKTKKGAVQIGFERGSDENAKAEGNILGTYGKTTANRSKARNFLGISESDLKKLERKFLKERD